MPLRSAWLLVVLIAACSSAHCEDRVEPVVQIDLGATAEVLSIRFEDLYPTFLWYRSMSQGDKSALWTKYRGRWVKWEGVIASITDKGITVKQLLLTATFDVSLTCEAAVVSTLKQRFTTGQRVRYIGMLDSYDDVFRTMYLSHGVILEIVPHADLGMPSDMARSIAVPR